jgi:hypothetical protein
LRTAVAPVGTHTPPAQIIFWVGAFDIVTFAAAEKLLAASAAAESRTEFQKLRSIRAPT